MGKMPDRTDIALLEAWSDGGSEDAFAALARRYGGLLYHAALRRTGRDDLAGEAAQNSLLILARKAPQLRHLPSLAGWLHRTACYEAYKLLRRESRHQARMKHLPLPHDEDGDASWKDAAPLLDRALDELPEKDRQVIFLKYFEGLSFEQMARRFGGEPAAWRQRGSRAVERLKMSLTKRGAAVSATALATGLSTSFTQAAPTAFLATLPPASTAVAALSWKTLSLHSLHLMKMKPAVVVAATLLLSLVPLGIQANAIAGARERVALLESAAAGAAEAPARGVAAAGREEPQIQLAALAEALLAAEEGDLVKRFSTEKKIEAMDPDELERLLLDSTTLELGPEQRNALVRGLFRRFCQLAGSDRVVALALRLVPTMSSGQGMVWNYAGNHLEHWVNQDPDAAAAFYRSWEKPALSSDVAVLAAHIFDGLQRRDPDDAADFFGSLSDAEKQAVISGGGGIGDPARMLDLASGIGNDHLRGVSIADIFRRSGGKPPQEVRSWVDGIQAPANRAARLLATAALGLAGEMPAEVAAERIDWLREAGAGLDLSLATGIFLSDMGVSSPATVKQAVDAEWERRPDEQMLAAYIRRCLSDEELIIDAIPRSRLIEDSGLRDSALRTMLLTNRSTEEARELARRGGLAEDEIERLLR